MVRNGTITIISLGIQDITYTYDAVGNITQITDTSNTEARHTALYTYDTLYRLTSAMTSVASSSPYLQTYSYDPLGNITYRSDVGSYLYQGSGMEVTGWVRGAPRTGKVPSK